jgi:hypothetical protein
MHLDAGPGKAWLACSDVRRSSSVVPEMNLRQWAPGRLA